MNNTNETIKITSRITGDITIKVALYLRDDRTYTIQEALDNLVSGLAVLMVSVERDQIDSFIDASWHQAERILDRVNNEPTV